VRKQNGSFVEKRRKRASTGRGCAKSYKPSGDQEGKEKRPDAGGGRSRERAIFLAQGNGRVVDEKGSPGGRACAGGKRVYHTYLSNPFLL